MYALACMCAVYLLGGGLIIEANIPVQELEGQRGEGAYFGRIWYYQNNEILDHIPSNCKVMTVHVVKRCQHSVHS